MYCLGYGVQVSYVGYFYEEVEYGVVFMVDPDDVSSAGFMALLMAALGLNSGGLSYLGKNFYSNLFQFDYRFNYVFVMFNLLFFVCFLGFIFSVMIMLSGLDKAY